MNPDYPLCDQTVTLFRKEGNTTRRWEIRDCHFSYCPTAKADGLDRREDTGFLLILPGDGDIRPGDRVCPGIPAEDLAWEDLIPACIPGVCQVAYARPFYREGRLCHTEAGR